MVHMIQRLKDAILEARIRLAMFRLVTESNPDLSRIRCKRMGDLIKQRSPSQVRRMEEKRGLV